MRSRVYIVVYTCCCWLYSVRGNVIDFNTMPMTLLNATNFIMRHQRYLLQDDENAATGQITSNEVNLDIDENVENFVKSPLVLTTEVCNPVKCRAGKMDGVCISGESCFKHSGQIGNPCNGSRNLICCTFLLTCGDVSNQKVTYLQSPDNLKIDSGSLACDYDVTVRNDTCAIRVDYESVNLASKIGGVCDIDQVYILNSIDGPATGQCGPLTGYSTVVAVEPNQEKPLKIAMVVQSEPADYWLIKVSQIGCTEIKPFKELPDCGRSSVGSPYDENAGNPSPPRLTSSSGSGRCVNVSGDVAGTGEPKGRWKRPRRRSPVDDGAHKVVRWWSRPAPSSDRNYRTANGRDVMRRRRLGDDGGHNNRRIVGGGDANIGEYTWHVAVALDGLFFCGGALISDRFVITAAHCVMTRDTPLDDLMVHLGDYDLTVNNETEHQVRKVSRVLFHSHFHPFLLANDIALLQLDRPATASKTVRPVCLPSASGSSYVGRKGTVVGWGITSFPSGDPSPTVQKLVVEVLSNFQCSRVINDHVGLGMLCAAAPSLQGTCFGDSGGPLTVERDTGQNVLVGLVSYGVTGCAVIPAFPDLYTRVSEYAKWIDVNTSTHNVLSPNSIIGLINQTSILQPAPSVAHHNGTGLLSTVTNDLFDLGLAGGAISINAILSQNAASPTLSNANSYGLGVAAAAAGAPKTIGPSAAAAAAAAAAALFEMTTDDQHSVKREMDVPESIVGAIIGPGGRSLVEIQQMSGVTIHISKKGVYAPGTTNRKVTICGSASGIAMANYLMQQRIVEEETKRARAF